MDYKKLKDEFQTPFYIYDFDFIKERFLKLKNAFKARKSQIFLCGKSKLKFKSFTNACKA